MRAEQTTWPNAEIAFLVFTRGRFTEELIKQIFLTKINGNVSNLCLI